MTPANDNRPAEFDSSVVAHLPLIQKIVARYCHPNEREEVVQDVVVAALANWQKFRPEGSFYRWLGFKVMHVTRNRKTADRFRGMTAPIDKLSPDHPNLSVAATQDVSAEASQLVRFLSATREGKMLLRFAYGDSLAEIGRTTGGLCRERVRQLTDRARTKATETFRKAA